MEDALSQLLLGDPAIGLLVDTRVHWDAIPQGTKGVAIVMFLISSPPDYTMSGPSGLVQSRVQIDCRAATKPEAKAAANAVMAKLSGYRGRLANTIFGGVFKLSERSRHEKPSGSEEFYTASADYQLSHGSAG